ncbi:MAG: thiamine-phosphate synthase family protein [Methanoregula sp.]|nr:thiamine-phosphate synthase family protein [Methanoregula sp.]
MTDSELIEMYGKMAIALDLIEHCREFAEIIPEVRSNLVFARENAKSREDILAIDGRITVVDGMPHAAGKPKFGASSHMARLIIEYRKYDPSIRAGIDFANTPDLTRWLERYCSKNKWTFSVIDRRNEPEEIKEAEGASMPWKVKEAIRAAGDRPPKIFYETGAVGKEPVSVLVGRDPLEIVSQICTIAKLYHDRK